MNNGKIIELRNQGLSYRQISKKAGVSYQSIWVRVKKIEDPQYMNKIRQTKKEHMRRLRSGGVSPNNKGHNPVCFYCKDRCLSTWRIKLNNRHVIVDKGCLDMLIGMGVKEFEKV